MQCAVYIQKKHKVYELRSFVMEMRFDWTEKEVKNYILVTCENFWNRQKTSIDTLDQRFSTALALGHRYQVAVVIKIYFNLNIENVMKLTALGFRAPHSITTAYECCQMLTIAY